MVKGDKAVWKSEYFLKLQVRKSSFVSRGRRFHSSGSISQRLIEEYPKIFIVGADNVGSRQMQQIRMSLRGMAGENAVPPTPPTPGSHCVEVHE